MILDFIVPGEPIAQPRPRASVIRFGKKYVPRLRECDDDHPVLPYKQTIASCAKDIIGLQAMGCAMGVELEFVRSRPESMIWKKKAMPREIFDGKPDIDNLTKSVLDALSGIIFKDDGQVFGLRASKWYAAGDETAHTKVTIYTTVEEFFQTHAQLVAPN